MRNFLLTLLIGGRLLSQARKVTRVLGAEHARKYVSLTALLVETAAPLSICSVLVLANEEGNIANVFALSVFSPILSQLQVCCPCAH